MIAGSMATHLAFCDNDVFVNLPKNSFALLMECFNCVFPDHQEIK
jgi:hypothetical protein